MYPQNSSTKIYFSQASEFKQQSQIIQTAMNKNKLSMKWCTRFCCWVGSQTFAPPRSPQTPSPPSPPLPRPLPPVNQMGVVLVEHEASSEKVLHNTCHLSGQSQQTDTCPCKIDWRRGVGGFCFSKKNRVEKCIYIYTLGDSVSARKIEWKSVCIYIYNKKLYIYIYIYIYIYFMDSLTVFQI